LTVAAASCRTTVKPEKLTETVAVPLKIKHRRFSAGGVIYRRE